MRIEPATEQDVPVVYELMRSLAEYERLADLVTATEHDLREALFGASRMAQAAIASLDASPVGYALWFYTYSTFRGRRGIYLEDLFVTPQARGKGVGRALLEHLARTAVADGCIRIEWAVLNWNESAIRFYDGLGANPIDGWTIYRLDGEALAKMGG